MSGYPPEQKRNTPMRRLLLCYLALIAALIGGPAFAEKKPQPGLFVEQGKAVLFKVVDGQPAEVRPASADEQPRDGEIRVTLRGGMMTVLNSGPQTYDYQAFIAKDAAAKGQRTSVCTLMPGIASMESWPGALPGIRLTNFTPAEAGAMNCR
jgi:hypothetical protein